MIRASGHRPRGGTRRQPSLTVGAALDRRRAPASFPFTSQEAKV